MDAECLGASRAAQPAPRTPIKLIGGPEFVFGLQQPAEVLDGATRAWMPIAEGLALHLQRLAVQRLRGGEVALDVQQVAEVVDGGERVRMPIAELWRLAQPFQYLADNTSASSLALGLQLRSTLCTAPKVGNWDFVPPLIDAFPVEHRVNTSVQHARRSSRMLRARSLRSSDSTRFLHVDGVECVTHPRDTSQLSTTNDKSSKTW